MMFTDDAQINMLFNSNDIDMVVYAYVGENWSIGAPFQVPTCSPYNITTTTKVGILKGGDW